MVSQTTSPAAYILSLLLRDSLRRLKIGRIMYFSNLVPAKAPQCQHSDSNH